MGKKNKKPYVETHVKGIGIVKRETNPDTWKSIIELLNRIPEVEVVSHVNNDKCTSLILKVTCYKGLMFVRDAFTTGWRTGNEVVNWESTIMDIGFAPTHYDSVFIRSSFEVYEGDVDKMDKNIYLFFTQRHLMRIAKMHFGMFADEVD